MEGDDGQLQLRFRVNRGRLAAAQALDGHYVVATNAAQLDAEQAQVLQTLDWRLPAASSALPGLGR